MRAAGPVLLALVMSGAACSPAPASSPGVPAVTPRAPAPPTSKPAAPHRTPTTLAGAPSLGGPVTGGPAAFPPTGRGPLDGRVVAVDPGHNGGNSRAPSFIDRIVWNGRGNEACDTTGAATDSGYTESRFNFAVAGFLTADLRAEGAAVVLTRTSDDGVGPCITDRAAIGNQAHAAAAISIHADGGPASGYGFAILEPVADGVNAAIVAPSQRLGADLRSAFAAGTGEQVSTYDGVNGIQPRDDLGGINLSTVPKVFIECANMRNPVDAAKVSSPAWQALAAKAIAAGMTNFLTR